MNLLIDFNQGTEIAWHFGGAERKIPLMLNGQRYMLKYPKPQKYVSKTNICNTVSAQVLNIN